MRKNLISSLEIFVFEYFIHIIYLCWIHFLTFSFIVEQYTILGVSFNLAKETAVIPFHQSAMRPALAGQKGNIYERQKLS